MTKHICPNCHRVFPKKYNLNRHLNRLLPCLPTNEDGDYVIDQQQNINAINSGFPNSQIKSIISGELSSNENEISIEQFKKLRDEVEMLKSQPITIDHLEFKKLREKVEMLESKPSNVINNQVLQVVCVKNDENYLDLLTGLWGDHDKALEFIKDCALSSLSGDCKLLKKIYFSSNEAPIRYLDNARTKLEYFNEKKERIIDHKGERLCRILANNLQNSYLKGVNYVINRNLENKLCPNKFLEDYDIQSWNSHIYQLSDEKYQKKIISQLDIPKI